MRGHATYLLATGGHPMSAYIDTDDTPAVVPGRWFDGCRRTRPRRGPRRAGAQPAGARVRRQAQPLGDARVAPVTRERYVAAKRRLLAFWTEAGKRPRLDQEVDEGVAAYVEHAWRSNGSLLEVNNTLAAVPYFSPRLSGKLKLSRKLWLAPPGEARYSESKCREG